MNPSVAIYLTFIHIHVLMLSNKQCFQCLTEKKKTTFRPNKLHLGWVTGIFPFHLELRNDLFDQSHPRPAVARDVHAGQALLSGKLRGFLEEMILRRSERTWRSLSDFSLIEIFLRKKLENVVHKSTTSVQVKFLHDPVSGSWPNVQIYRVFTSFHQCGKIQL